MKLSILVSGEEQLFEALDSRAERIIVESSFLPFERMKETAQRIKSAGKQAFLAFPQIFRERAVDLFKNAGNDVKTANFDGFLIRSHETLAFLDELGIEGTRLADHNLYVWNSEAKEYSLSHGYDELTAPIELTCQEMADVDFSGQELIVYGSYPMMVSAGCLFQTVDRCDRKGKPGVLVDRMNHEMVVTRDCRICMNTILNNVPVSLVREKKAIEALQIGHARLVFTTESASDVKAWIRAFEDAFFFGQDPVEPEGKPVTRGHFRKKTE